MTRAATKRPPSRAVARSTGYFESAETPFTSLLFLLPMIVLYEVGTHYLGAADGGERHIIAFDLLQRFFNWCGATGKYLPPLAVVAILLGCHVARRDPWNASASTIAGMCIESFVLALPLIVLGALTARAWSLSASNLPPTNRLVLSIGAGVYEELIFRLIGYTLLHALFVDVLGLKKTPAYLLIVAITSVLFAGYHYLGAEHFAWSTFVFRTMAGVYFGLIFAFRGFGVTAGSHAAYDVINVLLSVLLPASN